jgi:hypothetical protein
VAQCRSTCHPDRHGGCTDKEAHFKSISEAYECLKDPQKRAAYDRFGHAAFQNGGGGGPFGQGAGFEGFSDIFSSIFGEFMDPRAQRESAARGSDLRYDLELTLEEAFAGVEKTISIQALARCESCNASGSKGESAPRACGTTPVCGIPELVIDKVTGLLVPPQDPGAIASALRWVCAHPEEVTAMTERGRAKVASEYSRRRNVEELVALWDGLRHGMRAPDALLIRQ